MKKDILIEMMTGHKGAFKTIAKLITYPTSPKHLNRTLLAGVSVELLNETLTEEDREEGISLPKNCREFQMWECEIIILPRRVYQGLGDKAPESFRGLRIDQILRSNWSDPEIWEKKIFDIKE